MNDKAQLSKLTDVDFVHPNDHYGRLVVRVNGFIREAWPGSDVEPVTRLYRALEEVLELGQVLGLEPVKAHELVDYVYGRPVGELEQEAGGVAFTITGLFASLGLNFIDEGNAAVDEAYGRIDVIRAKSKTKPKAR